MKTLNISNYHTVARSNHWWQDTPLSTVEVTRAFKAWLRTHDDRIANLANLLDDNGASEIIEHTSTGKRIKADARSRGFLDTWARHTLISSWGNDPLPLTREEAEVISIAQGEHSGNQLLNNQKGYTKKEAVALVQARVDKFHLERSQKEKEYTDFWRSVGTDIYIFLATHYMKEFNTIKWGIQARNTRGWSNRMPYVKPIDVPNDRGHSDSYPIFLLDDPIEHIEFYRDGEYLAKEPNVFRNIYYATFYPVLNCWEVLHLIGTKSNREARGVTKACFPDVPHSWIVERNKTLHTITERFTESSLTRGDTYMPDLLLSNKNHLRESGETY